MADSPIGQLLSAIDRGNLDEALALFTPDARMLLVDGHRAEGIEAIRDGLGAFLGSVRTMSHEVTSEWHPDGVWIAEVSASYHLKDNLRTGALPRVFVLRGGAEGISDVRVYGAHEQPLDDGHGGEAGTWLGGHWIPPL